jgi:putative transposase
MPKIARQVYPGYPHHIIQRGNRKLPTFFHENDYRYYLDLLEEWSQKAGLKIWTYCLMPNHVHFIAVPDNPDSLRLAMSQTHRRYTNMINKREGWSGHLWQARFASYVMDESYTLTACRYIEMNPVTAGIVNSAEDYAWSSAAHYLGRRTDTLLYDEPLKNMVSDWRSFLEKPVAMKVRESLEKHTISGKPLGSEAFIARL